MDRHPMGAGSQRSSASSIPGLAAERGRGVTAFDISATAGENRVVCQVQRSWRHGASDCLVQLDHFSLSDASSASHPEFAIVLRQ